MNIISCSKHNLNHSLPDSGEGPGSTAYRFSYQIQFQEDLPTVIGVRTLSAGANVITERLPQGTLRTVTAVMQFPTAAGERIFMNGYQTWTYCPELSRQDYTRRMGHFPQSPIPNPQSPLILNIL